MVLCRYFLCSTLVGLTLLYFICQYYKKSYKRLSFFISSIYSNDLYIMFILLTSRYLLTAIELDAADSDPSSDAFKKALKKATEEARLELGVSSSGKLLFQLQFDTDQRGPFRCTELLRRLSTYSSL